VSMRARATHPGASRMDRIPQLMRILLVAAWTSAACVASAATANYWVEPAPRDAGEAALHAGLLASSFAGPEVSAQALLRLADSQPGTSVSGLARLSAGWLLLDSAHPADAVTVLRHADIGRTALPDYGQYLLARALEDSGERTTAATTYLQAARSAGTGALACAALERAADGFDQAGATTDAVLTLERQAQTCPSQKPAALLRIAGLKEAARDLVGAAVAYDLLDRDYPASSQAVAGAIRLAALSKLLPPVTAEARIERQLSKGVALFDAGRARDAESYLRAVVSARGASATQIELAQTRLGRALAAQRRTRDAILALAAVPITSPHAAEAAFELARLEPKEQARLAAFDRVATRFPKTPWAEEALLALANNFQKDSRDTEALPYYRRLLEAFPDGRYADRSTWRVGWSAWRAGRYEEATQVFENAVRVRPVTYFTPGFLFWAGRARLQMGQPERGRQLLQEAVARFKRTYHGARAAAALALPVSGARTAPAAAALAPVAQSSSPAPASPDEDIPEPQLSRLRQLLLIERTAEALDELRALPPTPCVMATVAWLESRRGRLRPAITAMKRAYPDHAGAAGDGLPDAVWRILYPLEYRPALEERARQMGLDPALVAALVCQESTFEAGAVSRAGARGLMQIMPATGRLLARSAGLQHYNNDALHNPNTSLDLGMRYLRDMLDRFSGSVERALAAYNAGPHRVDAWTAGRPDMSAEEFVEIIPFTETRNYVMTILAAREQYRRVYGFPALAATAPAAAQSNSNAAR
jgi:soluble lytic murein transglycosylase